VAGVSGGERKRLAVATQLFANPKILFLDEPTTGLDAFQALGVVEMMHLVAKNAGRTVAATIHTPRGAIAGLFDDLILMSAGRVAYSGDASRCLAHFAAIGFPCAAATNATDHFIDVLSRKDGAETMRAAWAAAPPLVHSSVRPRQEETAAKPQPLPWLTQLQLLCQRSLTNTVRDPIFLRVDLGLSVVVSCYLLLVLRGLERDARGLRSFPGLLYFIMVSHGCRSNAAAIAAANKYQFLFTKERRDYSQRALMASRQLVDFGCNGASIVVMLAIVLPSLGLCGSAADFVRLVGLYLVFAAVCWTMGLAAIIVGDDDDARTILGSFSQTVLVSAAGFFRPLRTMRAGGAWLATLSHFRWLLNGATQLTMRGRRFGCGVEARGCVSGDGYLQLVEYSRYDVSRCAAALLGLYAGWSAIAYCALLKPMRYQQPKH